MSWKFHIGIVKPYTYIFFFHVHYYDVLNLIFLLLNLSKLSNHIHLTYFSSLFWKICEFVVNIIEPHAVDVFFIARAFVQHHHCNLIKWLRDNLPDFCIARLSGKLSTSNDLEATCCGSRKWLLVKEILFYHPGP